MKKLVEADMSVPQRLAYLRDFYLRGLWRVALPLTVAFLAATYIWPHIKRIVSVRSALDMIILKAPVWGSLHKSRALARFGKSLAQLYSAGISPGPAWIAASYSCPNSIVANGLHKLGRNLDSGATFAATMASSGVFDHDTEGLILAGEQAGDLPGVLQKVEDFNEGLAAAQHRKGRWISMSLGINALIIMTGILAIMFAAGYAKVVSGVGDWVNGGR
jgi:type II secretory pathway component PulF